MLTQPLQHVCNNSKPGLPHKPLPPNAGEASIANLDKVCGFSLVRAVAYALVEATCCREASTTNLDAVLGMHSRAHVGLGSSSLD